MYWKMYADYRKEHIITTGMCTPRLAEIAHCEIRNLHAVKKLVTVQSCKISLPRTEQERRYGLLISERDLEQPCALFLRHFHDEFFVQEIKLAVLLLRINHPHFPDFL